MTGKKLSTKGNVGVFMEENSQQIEKLQQQMLEMQKELEAKQSRELLANLLLLPDTYFENAEVVKAIEVLNTVKNDIFLEKEVEKKESSKKKKTKPIQDKAEGTIVLLGDAQEAQNEVNDIEVSNQETDSTVGYLENIGAENESSEHMNVPEFDEEERDEELNTPLEVDKDLYDYPNVSLGDEEEEYAEEFEFEESYDEEYDAPEEFTEAADFSEIYED